MATEISRTFNTQQGAVIVTLQDALGNNSVHTLYVTGPNPVTNVPAAIAQIGAEIDAAATAIQAAFTTAGWTAPAGS
jgi:hypothetical protein